MKTQAKGAVVVATLDFIRSTWGGERADAVMARLDGAERASLQAASVRDEVPLDHVYALWRAADAVLSQDAPDWAERAGAHSITSKGVEMYGGIVRKPTPLAFLTQGVSLFRLFYHSGEMQVVEREEGRAVLRLLDFEDVHPLFCRRQTGGLSRAVELAGGAGSRARHVRCVSEGDAFCEWELSWTEGT